MIDDCIRLGMLFKCSPFDFFDLPISQLYGMMQHVTAVLEQQR